MTPTLASLRARRKTLGLTVVQVAYAARIRHDMVTNPPHRALARLDAALTALEAGGSVEAVRRVTEPGKTGPKPKSVPIEREPHWPPLTADPEHGLSGQCFRGKDPGDGRGRVPSPPETVVPRDGSLGES